MPAKPITIGTHHFAKKGDAADFLKAMLSRYDVGDKVGADDEQFLKAAIALHPDAENKIGCGIEGFREGLNKPPFSRARSLFRGARVRIGRELDDIFIAQAAIHIFSTSASYLRTQLPRDRQQSLSRHPQIR
jgi:hypothetical protein